MRSFLVLLDLTLMFLLGFSFSNQDFGSVFARTYRLPDKEVIAVVMSPKEVSDSAAMPKFADFIAKKTAAPYSSTKTMAVVGGPGYCLVPVVVDDSPKIIRLKKPYCFDIVPGAFITLSQKRDSTVLNGVRVTRVLDYWYVE